MPCIPLVLVHFGGFDDVSGSGIAGDFSSFPFEPRGLVLFEGTDRRGGSDLFVVRVRGF